MNEEQKKVLSLMRDELNDSQINRIIDLIGDLDLTSQELMSSMNVLDVVRNRNVPRIQLLSVFCNMSKTLQDILSAKNFDDEN